jgi:MFS transporter, DHA2 family, multidrug resistance protein
VAAPSWQMDGTQRFFLTLASVLATTLMAVDITIASVALPQIQGAMSATADQVSWILTSYVIALAVATPVVSPLALRFGRKRVFLAAVAGFTVASVLCGLAWSLELIVLFRLIKGLFAAALVPISQAVLMDSYPPERQGEAMAYWTIGVMVGPIIGPLVGGTLTDALSWRWIFFVNLPFGLLAYVAIAAFLPRDGVPARRAFDWSGFAALTIGLASLQFMLDRGERFDWFDSRLIVALALLSIASLWVFAAHSWFARRPFIPRELFLDRNFMACLLLTFVTSGVFYANLSLTAPMLQSILGFPARETGLMLAPRGVGVLVGVACANLLRRWWTDRTLIGAGLAGAAVSVWLVSGFSLQVGMNTIIEVGIAQGFFYGVMFVPLTTATFATLAPALRTDGAALIQLVRQLAGGIGIAITFGMLTRGSHGAALELATRVNPAAPAWQDLLDSAGSAAPAVIFQEVSRQAAMLAYLEVVALMSVALWLILPLLVTLRRGRGTGAAAPL